MIELPDIMIVPVLRLDFSDDRAWQTLRAEVMKPAPDGSGYVATVEFFDRADLSDYSPARLEAEVPRRYPSASEYCFLIVVDRSAMSDPEHPVLLIDLNEDEPEPSFRALPREVAAIEANLSLGHMGFYDFASNADSDGVFRGFDG